MDPNMVTTVILFALNIAISAIVGFVAASFKIGEYKNKVDGLEMTMGKDEHGGLRKTVGEIRDKVIACETTLYKEPLTKRKSPVSLTERGDQFLNESGGKKFVDDNFDSMKDEVEKRTPKTAYDIQEFSREIIESKKDQDKFSPLKDYLFKEGLELNDLVLVMGIYLRDKILSSKGLAPEEVDKTDPKKNATSY